MFRGRDSVSYGLSVATCAYRGQQSAVDILVKKSIDSLTLSNCHYIYIFVFQACSWAFSVCSTSEFSFIIYTLYKRKDRNLAL